MKQRLLITLLLACSVFLPPSSADDPPRDQWIAVVAPGLRETIRPLCELRERRGFQVVVVQTTDVLTPAAIVAGAAKPLRDKVRELWVNWSGGSYVLLVGAPLASTVDEPLSCVVPTLSGTIARMAGQPTDNGYGCVDGELLARVPIGRLPARSKAEATAMVHKTLAWETARRPGTWKRRFVLLAGAPSYNPLLDRMIESLALSQLADLDPIWSGQAIYHNPNSYFALPDDQLLPRARAYLKTGPAVAIYLGHSSAPGFWHSKLDGRYVPHFAREHWAGLDMDPVGGVFVTLGCNGTQLHGETGEGYGLYAMRNPRGPVAVIGYQGICWANMAMLSTKGLLENLPDAIHAPRLGEIWLALRRTLGAGPIDPLTYHALDAVDGDPNTPADVQRREHQEMILLLGDPALRFPATGYQVRLNVSPNMTRRKTLNVTGTVPPALAGAAGYLRLERTLTSPAPDVVPLTADLDAATRAARMQANHERSNRFVLQEVSLKLEQRDFLAELNLPEPLPWKKVVVRVYLANDAAEGMAARLIRLSTDTP